MPPLLMSLRMPCRNARLESADERGAGGEGHRVGDDGVHHRHHAGDGEARHHGVADVLLTHHAAVEKAETRDRHHQHQRHRGQHPCGVAAARRTIRQHGRHGGDGSVLLSLGDRGNGCRTSRDGRRGWLCRRSRRSRSRRSRSGRRFGRRGRGALSVSCNGRREANEGGRRQRRGEAGEDACEVSFFQDFDLEWEVARRFLERVLVLLACADPHR